MQKCRMKETREDGSRYFVEKYIVSWIFAGFIVIVATFGLVLGPGDGTSADTPDIILYGP